VPEERRIQFRIGINLGDIIKDGRDIYGDGVNVAARLEGWRGEPRVLWHGLRTATTQHTN
jgi:class 3 adenylate cyclase